VPLLLICVPLSPIYVPLLQFYVPMWKMSPPIYSDFTVVFVEERWHFLWLEAKLRILGWSWLLEIGNFALGFEGLKFIGRISVFIGRNLIFIGRFQQFIGQCGECHLDFTA
jgi:hypothetical protein